MSQKHFDCQRGFRVCWENEYGFTIHPFFIRSTSPEVFLGKIVQKVYKKFTGEHPCTSVISTKLVCNFTETTLRHGCSFISLRHIFRTPFYKNIYGGLLLFHTTDLLLYLQNTGLFLYPLRSVTCVKSVCIWSFSDPYLNWICRDTLHLSVFSPNAEKYRPEKLRIWTFFTQWWIKVLSLELFNIFYFNKLLSMVKLLQVNFLFKKDVVIMLLTFAYSWNLYLFVFYWVMNMSSFCLDQVDFRVIFEWHFFTQISHKNLQWGSYRKKTFC